MASADTIIGAFRRAATNALLIITAVLAVALRRLLDVALVMATLLVSAALTVMVAALLPLPLNFANVIALPLSLGCTLLTSLVFVPALLATMKPPAH